jgi:hypothetical protein
LEKNFNPSIKKTLAKNALNISQDRDFIEISVKQALLSLSEIKKESVSLDIKKLLKKHISLQNGVVRKAILLVKKDLKDIESSHVEEVIKIIRSNKGKKQKILIKGLNIEKNGGTVSIS